MPLFGREIPGAKPGAQYSTKSMNHLIGEAQRLLRLSVGGGMAATSSPSGVTLSGPGGERVIMNLTAVDGSDRYTWQEQVYSGGAWVNATRSGGPTNDPAYNLNTAHPTLPWRVFAWRSPTSGVWTFAAGTCPNPSVPP